MVQDSIQTLQARGYKATRPRKLVLEVLQEIETPLSPYDIQGILRARGKYLNHVTIYRTLDLLCSLKLAHKMLSSGGFVKCSLDAMEGCHRFMVCQDCGAIQEFADEGLCQKENEFARNLGFRTEHHLSEFSGLCSRCHKERSLKHANFEQHHTGVGNIIDWTCQFSRNGFSQLEPSSRLRSGPGAYPRAL